MHTYQVKRSLSALAVAALIFQISSPIFGMQAQPSNSKPSSIGHLIGPALGIIGTGLGWFALKRYQAKKDKVFKETKQQLPKELQKLLPGYGRMKKGS